MLLIYTTASPPRLRYTFDLIFKDLIGIEYNLTHDKDEFINSAYPKLNYSENIIRDELFFFSSPLLFEKKIRQQDISVFDYEDTKAFFATHPKYAMPFDVFAASFYLVSRYEEYLPHQRDGLNRFQVKESLAGQKGFLQKPLVNLWAKKLEQIIHARYPQLVIPEKKYTHLSTIDIDNAYAYKEKGAIRTAGAWVRSILSFDKEGLKNHLAVITGLRRDPYDTYETLMRIQKQYHLKSIYFFLLGDYAENDKNVPVSSRKLQSLIKYISDYAECGIHPSFASNTEPDKILLEKGRLRKIIRRDVTKCRQHFLMLQFPQTYRNLLQNDMTDDYTMGYAEDVGFRASICSPFYFYDLKEEVKTKLRVHPFAVMDATLLHYLKVKPDEALNIIKSLVEEVKAVNGTFISLWHNESLSNIPPWKGWQNMYEEMVKIAQEDKV
jgi:hypothetical protein